MVCQQLNSGHIFESQYNTYICLTGCEKQEANFTTVMKGLSLSCTKLNCVASLNIYIQIVLVLKSSSFGCKAIFHLRTDCKLPEYNIEQKAHTGH